MLRPEKLARSWGVNLIYSVFCTLMLRPSFRYRLVIWLRTRCRLSDESDTRATVIYILELQYI